MHDLSNSDVTVAESGWCTGCIGLRIKGLSAEGERADLGC